jgi:hypothetical protein
MSNVREGKVLAERASHRHKLPLHVEGFIESARRSWHDGAAEPLEPGIFYSYRMNPTP